MNFIRNTLVAVSMSALTLSVASVAMAKGAKKEPNCEVAGKKEHVKNEAACTKKKGTWMTPAAATAAPAAAAPSEGAAAPAPTEEPKK